VLVKEEDITFHSKAGRGSNAEITMLDMTDAAALEAKRQREEESAQRWAAIEEEEKEIKRLKEIQRVKATEEAEVASASAAAAAAAAAEGAKREEEERERAETLMKYEQEREEEQNRTLELDEEFDVVVDDMALDENEVPPTKFEALRQAEEPRVVKALQDLVQEENRQAGQQALHRYQDSVKDKPEDCSDQQWLVLREASGDDLNACEKAFRDMDVNNDGVVTTDEVTRFLLAMTPDGRPAWAKDMNPFQEKKMKKMMQEYDHDGDHEIDLGELTQWWYSHPAHPEFYSDYDRLGADAALLTEEHYQDDMPAPTSFEALRRTDEPRVVAALQELVVGEMQEASEEAVDNLRDTLEDKPDHLSNHEWIRMRETNGEELTGAEKAYRDIKKKRNGNVSIAEVTKFFLDLDPVKRPVWAQQLDPSQQNKLKKTLAKYDQNGDNELTLEEFVEWWHSHPGHESAYGDRGVHTLISVEDLATPRTPATTRSISGTIKI